MKPIKDNVVIQIEVTNACHLSCANCSRMVGHHAKPFYMSLSKIEEAILSLQDFPGRIGLMGGEPALHPDFEAICNLFIKLIPDKRRREFWTSGYKWEEYKNIRELTFDIDLVHYNDHSKPEEGWHQPLLISIDEVVENKEKMWKLINNCWVQRRWSASITPKGAFFCEVAAALHHALDGPDGWEVKPGWWKSTEDQYAKQKEFACLKCSAALPMAEIPNNHLPTDMISKSNLDKLLQLNSPKVKANRIIEIKPHEAVAYLNSVENLEIGERGYLKSHPEWRPSEFRTKIWHAPGEGNLTPEQVRLMQKKGKGIDGDVKAKGLNNYVVSDVFKGKLILTKKVLKDFSRDVQHDLSSLDQLIDIEFDNVNQLFHSVDDWSGHSFSSREKDILLKHIAENKEI
jgi:hypothetical protein